MDGDHYNFRLCIMTLAINKVNGHGFTYVDSNTEHCEQPPSWHCSY